MVVGAGVVFVGAGVLFEGANAVFEGANVVFEGAGVVFEGANVVFEGAEVVVWLGCVDPVASLKTNSLLTSKTHLLPRLPRVLTKMVAMEAGVKPAATGTTTTVKSTTTDPSLHGRE